jgi:cellulose synthase/poly-beta-1,6-N-acetylglucosamine synthase-like glycosyltransferase
MLIPAHNEEAQLGMALESVLRQSRPVDRIIVVSDNSTDRTVQIARRRANRGVEVIETVDNTRPPRSPTGVSGSAACRRRSTPPPPAASSCSTSSLRSPSSSAT